MKDTLGNRPLCPSHLLGKNRTSHLREFSHSMTRTETRHTRQEVPLFSYDRRHTIEFDIADRTRNSVPANDLGLNKRDHIAKERQPVSSGLVFKYFRKYLTTSNWTLSF